MKIFEAFGIDYRILIAQLVNFGILVFVLWKFAYKPMFKMLEDRRKKIEDGIENAAKAEKRLEGIEKKEKEVLKEAKLEAAKILENAKVMAEDIRKSEILKTQEEMGRMINKERENLQAEKAKVLREIKKEVSGLIVASLEKVLEEKASKKDEDLIKKAIKEIK
jgi:F-type H+-transporting ATPase subunit b